MGVRPQLNGLVVGNSMYVQSVEHCHLISSKQRRESVFADVHLGLLPRCSPGLAFPQFVETSDVASHNVFTWWETRSSFGVRHQQTRQNKTVGRPDLGNVQVSPGVITRRVGFITSQQCTGRRQLSVVSVCVFVCMTLAAY